MIQPNISNKTRNILDMRNVEVSVCLTMFYSKT